MSRSTRRTCARVCEVVGEVPAKCEATRPPMRTSSSYFSLRGLAPGPLECGLERSFTLYFTATFIDTYLGIRSRLLPRSSYAAAFISPRVRLQIVAAIVPLMTRENTRARRENPACYLSPASLMPSVPVASRLPRFNEARESPRGISRLTFFILFSDVACGPRLCFFGITE